MKKTLLLVMTLMLLSSQAMASTYVRGYTKKNGTYVQGHYRSDPDGIKWNNKSYRW